MSQLRTYRVTAQDTEGREYVYMVDAPSAWHAVNFAYASHGEARRSGTVTGGYLTLHHSVEEV